LPNGPREDPLPGSPHPCFRIRIRIRIRCSHHVFMLSRDQVRSGVSMADDISFRIIAIKKT
jgi:hypothetical protein